MIVATNTRERSGIQGELLMAADQLGLEELRTPASIRAYLAEFLGTMFFVLIGTSAVIVSGLLGGGIEALIAIAIAHGLAIAIMVYMTAKISGGHINPAVTFAMIVTQRMKPAKGFIYIVAQVTGGIMATALLYLALQNDFGNLTNFGAHGISEAVAGEGGALLIEILITAVLVMVIFAVAVARDNWGAMAPLVIGLTVMAIHFAAVPLTGASANPARTFGPALLSDAFDSFWVYIIGPAIGAALGGLLYQFVFLQPVGDTPEDG